MKKFFIFTCICGLALLAGACKDNKDVEDTRPAITTSVKNVDQTRILEAVEQTIRIEVVVAVQSGTVTEALTPVLKVDDAAVDKYLFHRIFLISSICFCTEANEVPPSLVRFSTHVRRSIAS